MEQAQAFNYPAHCSPSSDVGTSMAHHFEQFQRLKRPLDGDAAFSAPAAPASPPFHALVPAPVSGFRIGHHCCRICKTLLPATSYYPSNLKRSTFYCKACCVAKSQASASARKSRAKDSANNTAAPSTNLVHGHAAAEADHSLSPIRSLPDTALKMLNRLRRMCARPSECGLRSVLPNPVSLNFDVKVARQLLLWWNSTSALGLTTEADHELRFVPWLLQQRHDPTQPLQPWEVIPATRMQARRLTSTPTHLWAEMLEPSAVAHVVSKISELKRVISDHRVIQSQSTSLPTESDAGNAMCLT